MSFSFAPPLNMTLSADALGKSCLLIVFSLENLRIRCLLAFLQRQWKKEATTELRPKASYGESSTGADGRHSKWVCPRH